MNRPRQSAAFRVAGALAIALASTGALGAITCSVTATSVGQIYNAAANSDAIGSATMTCTRLPADPTSITFRLKADDGLNATTAAPFRRTQLGASGNFLRYILARGGCGNTSNWRAPATGTTSVQAGTVNFGTALSASNTTSFCIRLRGTAGGNPAAPPSGTYTDTFNVYAQYPNTDVGALSPLAPTTYTVGVSPQCVFRTLPTPMTFAYTSFSAVPVTASRNFALRCSTGLSWAVSVSPPAANLLGLNYTLAITAGVAGTGNGADQTVTVSGNVPAAQGGTCSTATCSASQAHTLTITY